MIVILGDKVHRITYAGRNQPWPHLEVAAPEPHNPAPVADLDVRGVWSAEDGQLLRIDLRRVKLAGFLKRAVRGRLPYPEMGDPEAFDQASLWRRRWLCSRFKSDAHQH